MATTAAGNPIVNADRQKIIAIAWISTVLFSSLPNIIFQDLLGRIPECLIQAKIALVIFALLASIAMRTIFPLRRFFTIFLVLYLAEWAASWLGKRPLWSQFFGGTFPRLMLGSQLLKLLVALVMVTVVLAFTGSFRASFLTLGARCATAKPEWFLPIRRPVPYSRFGPPLALIIGSGTLAFVLLGGRPSFSLARHVLPLLPLILLWSATNAFSEEYSYRASVMAAIRTAVGDRQALWITSFFFGVAHFYGIPYGILGVAMATCLGYVLGKAMLESEGILWPWLIHFVQDVVIFAFLAIGAITPGGR